MQTNRVACHYLCIVARGFVHSKRIVRAGAIINLSVPSLLHSPFRFGNLFEFAAAAMYERQLNINSTK